LPQAGGLCSCNAASFSALKKYASLFFNLAKGETAEKEAALQELVEGASIPKLLVVE
jgi:hypothetical protein